MRMAPIGMKIWPIPFQTTSDVSLFDVKRNRGLIDRYPKNLFCQFENKRYLGGLAQNVRHDSLVLESWSNALSVIGTFYKKNDPISPKVVR